MEMLDGEGELLAGTANKTTEERRATRENEEPFYLASFDSSSAGRHWAATAVW